MPVTDNLVCSSPAGYHFLPNQNRIVGGRGVDPPLPRYAIPLFPTPIYDFLRALAGSA
jgi:hypothetical protein